MENSRFNQLLHNEFVFYTRMGFGMDPPVIDEYGNHYLHEPLQEHVKYTKQMAEAGVKIQTCQINNGWRGVKDYDYKTPLEIVNTILGENPDIYFFPRIKLNPPLSWLEEYPEEIYVYENAPKSVEKIRALVGTKMQDTAGSHNREALIGYQSFSSQKWRKDAAECLSGLIDALESTKYADRIIGYHIAYGKCGETHMWGDSADYGVQNRKAYLQWALKKYGTLQTLEERWKVSNLSFENIPLPSNKLRYQHKKTLEEFFHSDQESAIYIDYNLYRKELSLETLNYFAKLVKERTGKLVGCFHGYIMHAGADYCGHTDLDEILDSPYIDFMAAPKSYYRSKIGEPGGSYCAALSVNRRKLWVDEIDDRNRVDLDGEAISSNDFVTVLWREFCKNTMNQSALWWMDLDGGWYDDEKALDAVAQMYDVKKELNGKEAKSASEILLVVDTESEIYTTQSYPFHIRCLQDMEYETSLIGAPHDLYCMFDLEQIDLRQYKFIIFLNAFKLDSKTWKRISKKMNPNATVLWNYTPGIIGEGFKISNVRDLTGFEIRQMEPVSHSEFPYIEILKTEQVVCEMTYKQRATMKEYEKIPRLEDIPRNEKTAVAIRKRSGGGISILSALPPLNAETLRKFAEEAGCHMYTPVNCTVYADSRFIGVFPSRDMAGKIRLKGKAMLHDAIGNKEFLNTDMISVRLTKHTPMVLIKE